METAGSQSYEAFVARTTGQLFVVVDHDPAGKSFWSVKAPLQPRPISTHDTQYQAIEAARALVKSWPDGGSLRIQELSGQFREEWTYPRSRDPFHQRANQQQGAVAMPPV